MAVDKLVDSGQLNSDLTTVANAIRAKSGGTTPLQFPNEFVTEIAAIPTGTPPTGTKTINITSNGTVTEDVSTYADAQVIANVPNTYTGADEGKVVDNGALVSQTSATYTTNNTYDTTTISSVTVNVSGGSPTLETVTKSYTPTESQQTEQITPSIGYDGIAEVDVTVGAISSTYVGSAIPQNDSSDLSASGATVTAPSGYYASNATLTIPSGSATTPATTITANPTISVSSGGLITATTSASQSVTPTVSPGYVSSGTSGTVSVSGSKTQQLTTQGATTITPTTSSQTAVAANTYTTGAITVDAMPSGTAGTPVATKSAVNNHSLTVTPSVTNTTGYITGSTLTGTAVTVSASELVSGTKSISANGTGIDVTDYAAVDVAVSGGGLVGNMIAHEEVTLVTTATNQNKLSVQMVANANSSIYAVIDELPAQPDSTELIALQAENMKSSYGSGSAGNILRVNGSVGTDGWISFNETTGIVQLGGSYGHLLAGTTYHIYQFEY